MLFKPHLHERLLHQNIRSKHKLHQNIRKQINTQQQITKKKLNSTGNSFITLKDHKENFLNRSTTTLLNHAKNEIGRISKHILQHINTTLSEEIKVNEWKNTESAMNWFKNIANKYLQSF